jgi:hypothetical protein
MMHSPKEQAELMRHVLIWRAVAGGSAIAMTLGIGGLCDAPAMGALATGRPMAVTAATPPGRMMAGAQPAINNNFQVLNAPSPVAFRGSPNWSYPTSVGFVSGNSMGLECYEYGAPAGPYDNRLWYEAIDYANGYAGWINDHYLSTPGTAAHPQPQTAECLPSGYGGQFNSGPTYQVVEAATSQYFDNSPNSGDYNGSSGYYDNGDNVQLYCYEYGAPTGPYGNPLWYIAYDPARGTYGWINDHYLNTPDTAAHPIPEANYPCGPCYRDSCIGLSPYSCPNATTSHSKTFNIEGDKVLVELRYSPECQAGWARLTLESDKAAVDVSLTAWNPAQPSQGTVPADNYTYAVNAAPGNQVCGGFQAWYIDEFGNKHYAGWHFSGCYNA